MIAYVFIFTHKDTKRGVANQMASKDWDPGCLTSNTSPAKWRVSYMYAQIRNALMYAEKRIDMSCC